MTFAERPPPHDEEMERALVGAALLQGSTGNTGGIGAHHLYEERHRVIWRAIERCEAEGAADAVLVASRLRADGKLDRVGGEDYLAQLCLDVPGTSAIAQYATAVMATARAREAIRMAVELQEAAYTGNGRLDAVMDEMVEGLRHRDDERPRGARCPTVAELLARDIEPRRWVVEGWLQEQKTMLLYGTSYTGKSLLSTQLALAIASGEGDVVGHRICSPARPTLIFMGENDELELRATIEAQVGDAPPPANLRYCDVFAQPRRHPLSTTEGLAFYRSVIVETGSKVAILDNLMSLVGGALTDSEVAQFTMEGLKRISKEIGVTWIVLAHTRKEGKQGDDASPADKLYGAHEWLSFADSAVYIAFDEAGREGGRRQIHTVKVRGARPASGQIVEIDEETLQASQVATIGKTYSVAPSTVNDAVAAILGAQGLPLTRDEIAEEIGVSQRTGRRIAIEVEKRCPDSGIEVAVRNRQGSATAFRAVQGA